jgi:predicted nuclease of predicted toxin-antitoxin system
MKFAVDAPLPRRLARQLAAAGHDALHCLDLRLGNRTPDDDIAALAANEGPRGGNEGQRFCDVFLVAGRAAQTAAHLNR